MIQLRIEYINLTEELPIHLDRQLVQSLLSCLQKLPFWDRFKYLEDGEEYLEYYPISNGYNLEDYFADRSKNPNWSKWLAFDEAGGSTTLSINFNLRSLTFRLSIMPSDVAAMKTYLVPRLRDFALEFITIFPNTQNVGSGIMLSVDTPFRKLRPPYVYAWTRWGKASILDIVDERHLAKNPAEEAAVLHGIKHLPRMVDYEKRGHFHVLTWIEDFSDERAVAEVLTERNKWIHQYMPIELDDDFNEFRDVRVWMQIPPCDNPYVSYLLKERDANNVPFHAIQTMVIMPDGSTDEPLLQKLAAWKKAGQLPDGTVLSKISLIVQDRGAAVLIFDRAMALGLYAVYYMDDEGVFWDIDPPGLWIN